MHASVLSRRAWRAKVKLSRLSRPRTETTSLLRTPKYERLLGEWERGVNVSFERYVQDDEELLEALHIDRKSAVVRLTTSLRNYELDIRKVDEQEVKAMREVLTRMNHDGRIRLWGV